MPFPTSIRHEALVKSVRRCCVCHRLNGVGVEVHHIKPEASGGANTLDNAIVLCFDCHSSAGHYNPQHPRGTKFSPKELLKHRDEWWKKVETAGTADVSPELLPDYYVKHLISMDYDAARELLGFETSNLPFNFDFLEENKVATFMKFVLKDDLPYTWATSKKTEGNYWQTENECDTLDEFHAAHPEFNGEDSRPISKYDFGPSGVRSHILKQCFSEGLSGEKLGRAILYAQECGGFGYTFYFSVRRPIFVFSQIKNTGKIPITLQSIISSRRSTLLLEPMPFSSIPTNLTERKMAQLKLSPGQSVIIPEMVLLTDPYHDDYETAWSEYQSISMEQGQDFGFRINPSSKSQDFFLIGPSESVHGFNAACGPKQLQFPVEAFDPNLCYIMARHWYVGSCPHVFYQMAHGHWVYGNEILSDAFRNKNSSVIHVPKLARKIRIVEAEPETTHLYSIQVDGCEKLSSQLVLQRDEYWEIEVTGGEHIVIEGMYLTNIPRPSCPAHIRQKTSLLQNEITRLNLDDKALP